MNRLTYILLNLNSFNQYIYKMLTPLIYIYISPHDLVLQHTGQQTPSKRKYKNKNHRQKAQEIQE
jgi:hypothetical protein